MHTKAFAIFFFLFFAAEVGAQVPHTKLPWATPGTAHVIQMAPPGMTPNLTTSGPVASVFPSKNHPAFMTKPGSDLVCHGLGTHGGQYACYARHGDTTAVDCFFDRYINETPLSQMCGKFPLPAKMTKAITSETKLPFTPAGTLAGDMHLGPVQGTIK